MVGWTHQISAKRGWSEDPGQDEARAEELAHKVLAIDPSNPTAYNLLAEISLHRRRYDEAIAYGEKLVVLAPNNAKSVALLGWILVHAERPQEGLPLIQKAIRLSPKSPAFILRYEGEAYHAMGRYEDAIAAFERALARNPKWLHPLVWLARTYADMGRMEEARAAAQEVLKLNRKFSAKVYVIGGMNYKDRAKAEHAIATLRELGLPE